MYNLGYKPKFIRQYNKLPSKLQQEVKLCLNILKNDPYAKNLKTHKLKGKLKNFYAVSVNYSHRVIFKIEASKKEIVLHFVGNHDIYQ